MSAASSARQATPRRPTLAEVANLAGVSMKTASRALNGEPNVADGTARRVREAADLLGFRLNGIARELRRGSTSTLVGLISGDLTNPFYSAMASGAERELRRHHLQLITANSDEDADLERNLIDTLLERRIRALLVVSSSERHEHLVVEGNRGVPFVFLDRPPGGFEADTVLIDNTGGGERAGTHLLAGGHRRIALMSDLGRLPTQQGRIEGFVRAMRLAGNTAWEPYQRAEIHDLWHAERTLRELLSLAEPPTAVFATNNRLTVGALRALRDHPAPPALVGFDDFDLAELLDVSVVAHDPAAMGRQAARLAHDRINGFDGPARVVTMPADLIARGSGERAAG
jgi:LacI family transcriptional regulator